MPHAPAAQELVTPDREVGVSISPLMDIVPINIVLTKKNYPSFFPKVGLALSGGSAKGLAYIGMFQVLEDHHIPVNSIAGTSIGSLIGSLYACGYSIKDIERIIRRTDSSGMFDDTVRDRPAEFSRGSLNNPALLRFPEEGPVGLSSGQALQTTLRKWTLQAAYDARFSFDKLEHPLRIVATDFLTGEKVVFRDGQIDRAVRASTSIPFIFKPFPYEKTYLVDGGASDIVPIDQALEMHPDVLIAVNVSSTLPLERDAVRSFSSYSLHLFDVLVGAALKKDYSKADLVIEVEPQEDLTGDDYAKLDGFEQQGREAIDTKILRIYELLKARSKGQQRFRLSSISLPDQDTHRTGLLLTGAEYYLWEIMRELYPPLATDEVQEMHVSLLPLPDGSFALNAWAAQAPLINDISWSGNRVPFDRVLSARLKAYVGMPYSSTVEKDIRNDVNNFYRELGYILVDVMPVFREGSMQVLVREVPIVEVTVTGNKFTSTEVIESLLKFTPMEVYNANKIDLAVQQLYATELFEYVDPVITRSDAGVHICFTLIERPYGLFYGNAQYFSAEERVELEVGHKNNYTFGYRLKSYARYVSGPRTDINLGFSRYNIFDTGLGWGIDYLKRDETMKMYTKHEYDISVQNDREDRSLFLEYWFLNYSIASLTYRHRSQYLTDEDKKYVPDCPNEQYTTAFDFKWDTLEKDFLASRGGDLILHYEHEPIQDFEKKSLQSTLAFSTGKYRAVVWKNMLGVSSGGRTVYDDFYLRRKWLPYGFSDFEAAGPNVVYSRLSYRFPLAFGLKGETAVNVFRSWKEQEDKIDEWENTGLGLSVHYPSFIGLTSFTYGVRDDGNSVWLLNVSNEFEE